jgi:hypothetical protein
MDKIQVIKDFFMASGATTDEDIRVQAGYAMGLEDDAIASFKIEDHVDDLYAIVAGTETAAAGASEEAEEKKEEIKEFSVATAHKLYDEYVDKTYTDLMANMSFRSEITDGDAAVDAKNKIIQNGYGVGDQKLVGYVVLQSSGKINGPAITPKPARTTTKKDKPNVQQEMPDEVKFAKLSLDSAKAQQIANRDAGRITKIYVNRLPMNRLVAAGTTFNCTSAGTSKDQLSTLEKYAYAVIDPNDAEVVGTLDENDAKVLAGNKDKYASIVADYKAGKDFAVAISDKVPPFAGVQITVNGEQTVVAKEALATTLATKFLGTITADETHPGAKLRRAASKTKSKVGITMEAAAPKISASLVNLKKVIEKAPSIVEYVVTEDTANKVKRTVRSTEGFYVFPKDKNGGIYTKNDQFVAKHPEALGMEKIVVTKSDSGKLKKRKVTLATTIDVPSTVYVATCPEQLKKTKASGSKSKKAAEAQAARLAYEQFAADMKDYEGGSIDTSLDADVLNIIKGACDVISAKQQEDLAKNQAFMSL